VHDFTPVEGGRNWNKLGTIFKIQDFLPLPEDAALKVYSIKIEQIFLYCPLLGGGWFM
jgi:hypothetical protein